MSGTEKGRTKQLAKSLGGRLVNNWTAVCTHLVMNTITVTVKVVSALAACKPIVTPEWLEEAVRSLKDGKVLPQTAGYLPRVVDENADVGVESFAPDYRRAKIFQDRVFYFFSEKQYSKLCDCVQVGGARCELASSSQSLEYLLVKESVAILVDPEAMTTLSAAERKWAEKVHNFMDSNGLRAVLDSEIGLALLHTSIETHCNPQRAPGHTSMALPAPSLSQLDPSQMMSQLPNLSSTTTSHSHSSITVLAPDTEPSQISILGKRGFPVESSEESNSAFRIDETVMHQKKARMISETLSQSAAATSQKKPANSQNTLPNSKGKSLSLRKGKAVASTVKMNIASSDTVVGSVHSQAQASSTGNSSAGNSSAGNSTTGNSSTLSTKDQPAETSVAKKKKKQINLDSLFGVGNEPSFQSQVKSKVSTNSQLLTSTQGHTKNQSMIQSLQTDERGDKCEPGPAPRFEVDAVVDDSQPDREDERAHEMDKSILPGVKQTINASVLISQSQILAPQPIEDPSLLAPSSLTPRSQDTSRTDRKWLSDSNLMGELFKGKRKLDTADDLVRSSEVGGNPAKKHCTDRSEITEHTHAKRDDTATMQSNRNPEKETVANSNSNFTRNGSVSATHLHVSSDKNNYSDSKNSTSKPKLNGNNHFSQVPHSDELTRAKKSDKSSGARGGYDKSRYVKSLDSAEDAHQISKSSASNDAPMKPPPPSPTPSTFLNTRERRRSKMTQANDSILESTMTQNSSFFTQQSTATSSSQQLTQSGMLINPFTSLTAHRTADSSSSTAAPLAATRGKRTKSTTLPPRIFNNNDMWGEEGEDREDPFAQQSEPESTARVYKPSLTEDGFVLPRAKPKLQTSRLGRFMMLSRREEQADGLAEEGDIVKEKCQLQRKVDIKVNVNMVSLEAEGGGGGERRQVVGEGGRRQINPLVIDFKRFKKFDQGNTGVPRILEVVQYIPATSNKLQDWTVSEDEGAGPGGEAEAGMEESSQERFQFALPPAKRKRPVL